MEFLFDRSLTLRKASNDLQPRLRADRAYVPDLLERWALTSADPFHDGECYFEDFAMLRRMHRSRRKMGVSTHKGRRVPRRATCGVARFRRSERSWWGCCSGVATTPFKVGQKYGRDGMHTTSKVRRHGQVTQNPRRHGVFHLPLKPGCMYDSV